MNNVYLISAELNENILYKVGYTRREVSKRMKEFKTGNASNFEIVDTFKSKWASKVEAHIKRKFSIYNINGEWFDLPINEVIDFHNTCKLIHDNIEILSKNNTWVIDNELL